MAIYSDPNRAMLATWVQYFLVLDGIVVAFIVLQSVYTDGYTSAFHRLAWYFIILAALVIVTVILSEKLRKPEDDGSRKVAEILASVQFFSHVLVYGFLLLVILLGLIGIFISFITPF